MRGLPAWIVVLVALFGVAAAPNAKTQFPIAFGVASWYGWAWEGRLTASGVRFHALLETAASRSLPLGSWIKVTNLQNGRSVVVQVTDRGPYVHRRILDLSLAAAIKLQMVAAGVVPVKIEPLSKKPENR